MEKSFEEHKAELEAEVEKSRGLKNGALDEIEKYMTPKDHIAEIEADLEKTRNAIAASKEEVEDEQDLSEQLKIKEAELFKKEVALTFKENDLQMFEGVVNITDPNHLEEVVYKLTGIVNEIKVGAGYVPKENAKQDSYNTAKEEGNTRNMIKALFGKR